MNIKQSFPIAAQTLVSIFMVAVLVVACGGVAGGSSSILSGVAAVGTPIASATINIVCTTGNALHTTTNSSGNWQSTLSGQTLPCAVEVSGGTVNGVANTMTYHSIAIASGTVNVTPLTDLMVANLVGTADTSTWFAGLSANHAQLGAIAQTQVDATLTNLRTALSGLPSIGTIDPIATPFTAAPGNIIDDMLTALDMATYSSGVTFTTLLGNASTPSFTPPAASFNSALTQSYASLASGIIKFEPKDLYVFPEPLGTTLNPAINMLQVGKPYTVPTPFSNCSYGANVYKQGSVATPNDGLTTWDISDTSIGTVTSQPTLANASSSLLGPMITINNYGTTLGSILSPALNITGYFNIHAINPGLFPVSITVPTNTLNAASFTLGAGVNQGMPLSPWTFRATDASVVTSITPAALGACGEVNFSSGVSGKAQIFADATGVNGKITVGPINVCVNNTAGTACSPTITITPSSASIVAGATVQLTAQETDTFGSVISPSSLVWTSSNSSVTVDANGLVTASASATGSATITATDKKANVSATSTITIIPNSTGGGGLTSCYGTISGALKGNISGTFSFPSYIYLDNTNNNVTIPSDSGAFNGTFDPNTCLLTAITIQSTSPPYLIGGTTLTPVNSGDMGFVFPYSFSFGFTDFTPVLPNKPVTPHQWICMGGTGVVGSQSATGNLSEDLIGVLPFAVGGSPTGSCSFTLH